MYANGFIGNRKMMEIAATQLGTIMNYLMGGKKSMGMRDILGSTWDFWDAPQESKTPEEIEEAARAKTKANLNTFFMAYGGYA